MTINHALPSPWTKGQADQTFDRFLISLLILATIAVFSVYSVTLPEISRDKKEQLPPRFAELLLPKPLPVEEPPAVPPTPEPLAQDIPDPIQPEQTVIVDKVPQTVKKAREKASLSGLLAFQDQLQDMRDAINHDALTDTATISRGAATETAFSRSLLTTEKSGRKASMNTADLSMETGGVALSARQTTAVDAPIEEQGLPTGAVRLQTVDPGSTRSIEEVRRVFDANKGAIYAIYNRALRNNPGLLGKVELELVIQPDGRVSECRVVTSELDDELVIEKIVRRVQMFDFGVRQVTVTRISYPVHFLPT